MVSRTVGHGPLPGAALGAGVMAALVVILFIAILLLGVLVPLRYAHGWVEVVSQGATSVVPMAGDSLVAIVSAALTGIAAVWLYLRSLAH